MTAAADLTDGQILGAVLIFLCFAAVVVGFIVALNLIIVYERDQHRARQARADIDARRQEREARSRLRPRTGDVAAAPVLAPLATVVEIDGQRLARAVASAQLDVRARDPKDAA